MLASKPAAAESEVGNSPLTGVPEESGEDKVQWLCNQLSDHDAAKQIVRTENLH